MMDERKCSMEHTSSFLETNRHRLRPLAWMPSKLSAKTAAPLVPESQKHGHSWSPSSNNCTNKTLMDTTLKRP